jgi:hypothetical protein
MNANNSVSTLQDNSSHSLINIGKHLYGFQITEAISLDGQSSQYLARSKESSYNQIPREVVIRLANLPHQSQSRVLLETEIEAYKKLYDKGGSRYIPHLLKTVQGDEQVLIREFIYGVPLQELFKFIRKGPIISEECILELGLRLADATWGLLQKGIPYFQIQPEHILITPEGRIVLLSLGRESRIPVPYLPPEAWLSMPLDWRSNQWSIGMVMLSLFLYNNDQDTLELEHFDFQSLHNSTHDLNFLLRSLIKNTQISPAIQMLLSEILQPAIGNRFEREDYFVQALLEAQSTIHNQNTLLTGQLDSLQALGDFMWNHAPMLKSIPSNQLDNTPDSQHPQPSVVYGHLSSEQNTILSRKTRIKQDILKEFTSPKKLRPNISHHSHTNTLHQTQKPHVKDLSIKKEHIEKKHIHQDQNPLGFEASKGIANEVSAQEHIHLSQPPSQSELQQEGYLGDIHTDNPMDASTQEIYLAGIQGSYDDGFLNTTELQFLITLDDVEQIEALDINQLERDTHNTTNTENSTIDTITNDSKNNSKNNSKNTYQQIIHYILPSLFLIGVFYMLFFLL